MTYRLVKPTLMSALLGGLATVAVAQSSITVFGVADAGLRQTSNGGAGTLRTLATGGNSTSRIGFRGQEDLGGGMAASFHLEAGLRIDTGASTGTQFYDRRSTVSLSHKPWGEIRLGRDQVPTHTAWLRADPFAFVGVASAGNLQSVTAANPGPIRSAFGTTASALTPLARVSNAVQWIAPGGLGGFTGQVLLAAGEGGTSVNGQHKVRALQLGYDAGPVLLNFASTESSNDLTTAGHFKDQLFTASGKIAGATVSAGIRRFAYGNTRQNNTLLAAVVPVGAGQIKFSWLKADLSGTVGTTSVNANDAQQIGLGYVHNLSRRSALYGTWSRINNGGRATFLVPDGPAALAGRNSSGWELGMRHTF
jgi:predicted porin